MSLTVDPPIHPGEILREQFLEPLGLSAGALAKAIGVPRTRVERIAKEVMGISPDSALRLAKYFDTSPNVWLNLQNAYDLAVGAHRIRRELATIHTRDANTRTTPGRARGPERRQRRLAGSGSSSTPASSPGAR